MSLGLSSESETGSSGIENPTAKVGKLGRTGFWAGHTQSGRKGADLRRAH